MWRKTRENPQQKFPFEDEKGKKKDPQLDLPFDDGKKKSSRHYQPTEEDLQFLTEMNDPGGRYISEEERKRLEEESRRLLREAIEKFEREEQSQNSS